MKRKSIDRAALTSEFVDKFKSNPSSKHNEETILTINRLMKIIIFLVIKTIRKAISMSFERDNIGKVILNNGAIGMLTDLLEKFR